VRWLREAADKGDVDAARNLAVCHLNGEGTEADLVQARRWFKVAATRGDLSSMHNLGKMYLSGSGGEPNPSEGLRWLQEAAERGLGEAQLTLGSVYADGEGGVPKDNVNAYAWWSVAAVESKAAADNGRTLELFLTPQQRAEAGRLADALRARIKTRAGLPGVPTDRR
jgi:hypothetical protein